MTQYTGVEIAVIGMSGQFPGADNIQEFWSNLQDGKESISLFEDQELMEAGIDRKLLNNPLYIKANAFLNNKEYFDADFFGYLPDEAKLMDPQIRLFHENCWKTLEDAGYDVETNTEKIGLFAGGSPNTNWVSHSFLSNLENSVNNFAAFHLRDITFLCSRISYLMNLQGPSIYINTACSTSLVAVQRACMSLLLRECKMALAGGVTIANYSQSGYLYQEGMIFSKDGHCRAFDENASGTVGGEGVGVVLLKRLQDAMADGDHIYAVIKGSGINNDGSDKMAYTAPGVEGQRQAILKAITMAKVTPESITYVEAHGTGTRLGDPVEVEALNSAFGSSTDKYCALGSVKTNIGHLDAAAGIAGFIKTVLALQHRQIPPSLHFSKANEAINFENSPFFVNTTLTSWKNDQNPLRAGVSSFGIGGTNVHVVLEEAPAREESSSGKEYQLLVISGKTADALERNRANLLKYLKGQQDVKLAEQQDVKLAEQQAVKLADVAYTLQTGRAAFAYRDAIVCADAKEAISLLEQSPRKSPAEVPKVTPVVVFMFPGQGSQYMGMCYDLYRQEDVFRREADKCFAIVNKLSGLDIKEVLFTPDGKPGNNITDTANTQPALFIVEFALAKLLMHWGIQPGIMIGHSIGEYVAACISGVFSLEDALRLVLKRGELMQTAALGKLLGVSISGQSLMPLLIQWKNISLAAVNSSEQCVVSGREEDIDLFRMAMEEAGYTCRLIRTSHAFHSYMMDEILEAFEDVVKGIELKRPQIPFISNVSGRKASEAEVTDPQYWVKHLRQTVRFSEGIENIFSFDEQIIFVEVGPGRTLCSLVQSNRNKGQGHKVTSLVRQSGVDGNDWKYLLSGLGQLWVNGIVPGWKSIYGQEKRMKISLPSYSFEKSRYPVLVDAFKMIMDRSVNGSATNTSWFYIPAWKQVPLFPGSTRVIYEKRNLIFIDENDIGESIARKYRQNGEAVVCVKAGSDFKKLTDDLYELNPGKVDDYYKLFTSLSENGGIPCKIVHGWSVAINADINAYFYSLLYMARALNDIGKMTERMIVLITNDLHIITGDETMFPEKAVALGLLKVVSQEYPMVSTSHIDISLAAGKDARDTDKLYTEIERAEAGGVVCLRRSQRLVQTYETIEPRQKETPLRKNGVYLITGGLGNLGFYIARCLLNEYDAKVILVGRTELPDEPSGKKTDKLRQLESTNTKGEVLYLRADISDSHAFEKALTAAEEKFGSICGVIHAAGIIGGKSINPISQLDTDDFECQFTAKVKGLQVLREVLDGKELDFCLVTSSLSSVLGGLGFASYASANIFMDHYISLYKERGELKNWISVNFDGLNFEQQAPDEENISEHELWPVIEKVLSVRELSRVVVSKTDLHRRLKDWIHRTPLSANGLKDDQPVIASPEAGVVVDIEGTMLVLWKAFFGRSTIERTDDFFEIGGDSLKALTLISRIYKTFQTEISVSEFFKRPNIKGLSDYIHSIKERETTAVGSSFFSITPAGRKENYPLSSVQRRLYFLHELNKGSLVYNIPQVLKMKGVLDRERLTEAFHHLIERHESLRTFFDLVNDSPVQKLQEDCKLRIEYFQGDEREAAAVIRQFIKPFDLYRAPLLRIGLLQTGIDEYLLLTDMHHIITDGVSFSVLIRDFMAFYNNEKLPPLLLQYKDFAEWQQGKRWQSLMGKHRSFWLKEFAEPALALDLPTDYGRPLSKSYAGSTVDFTLGVEETEGLRAMAAQEGATLFMALLSVYSVLLGRLCNQEDIVIGTPSTGRQQADLENIIGMFVNTLCLRNYPRGGLQFREYLEEVKATTLSCFDNQGYQYENLVEDLKLTRDTSRNPLFETMFIFRNFELAELTIPGLTVKPWQVEHGISKFDLSLSATERDGGLLLNFEYSTELFKPETIERIIHYFHTVVTTVITEPATRLEDIDFLPAGERHQLLQVFNDTGVKYPSEQSVISLFEKQVAKTPHHIAIVDGDERISFDRLNSWANRIAGEIKSRLWGSNQAIGLLFTPCAGMIAGMLAVMKAGCAYIPLSTHSSDDRNLYILSDCNARLLLSEQGILDEHRALVTAIGDHRVIVVGKTNNSREKFRNIRRKVGPGNLLYIIYTSGSTGKPKGVEVGNSGILNMLHFYSQLFNVKEGMNMSQVANVSFDAAAFEIWPCLTGGACLHIATGATRTDPDMMKTWLIENKIEISFQLPAIAEYLVRMDWDPGSTALKILHVAGDRFNYFGSKQLPFRIFNLYGPTENSIWTTWTEIDYNKNDTIYSIGKPIANQSIYILNKYHQLQPMGVPGELCIAGAGLARGYVNDPVLTKEKFVDNPYQPGQKMYRSGDYARWLEDGNIEFFGRIDNQVKIRGFRIELGEIESQLAKHPQLTEVAVMAIEREGDKYLVAYYTSTDRNISGSALKEFLLGNLADYMVPSNFIRLDSMPHTANGKINRNALPVPEIWSEEDYMAPSHDTEERLAAIWSVILNIEKSKISVNKSFFEIGGHSLKATILVNKIVREFDIEIPLRDIFSINSIALQADYIENERWIIEKERKQTFVDGEEFIID